jgi:hypothetical protein
MVCNYGNTGMNTQVGALIATSKKGDKLIGLKILSCNWPLRLLINCCSIEAAVLFERAARAFFKHDIDNPFRRVSFNAKSRSHFYTTDSCRKE